MVQKFIKFIKKSPNRKMFEKVMQDIIDNNLDSYDTYQLTWKNGFYKIRVWSVRFIFRKTSSGNMLIRVNNRWDVYKWI